MKFVLDYNLTIMNSQVKIFFKKIEDKLPDVEINAISDCNDGYNRFEQYAAHNKGNHISFIIQSRVKDPNGGIRVFIDDNSTSYKKPVDMIVNELI